MYAALINSARLYSFFFRHKYMITFLLNGTAHIAPASVTYLDECAVRLLRKLSNLVQVLFSILFFLNMFRMNE